MIEKTLEHTQALLASQPHYADDFIVCSILVCTFVLCIVLSDRKSYLARLSKEFFLPRENAIEGVRTTNIIYLRTAMYFVGLASTALIFTMYGADKNWGDMSHGILWIISCAVIILFYLFRLALCALTNRIFFDPSTTKTWEQGYACWTILSGIPLYLIAAFTIFFNLPPKTSLLLLAINIVALEICLLYKAFHIFSMKKYGILQIFIYLCTLELMPLFVAGKALVLFM